MKNLFIINNVLEYETTAEGSILGVFKNEENAKKFFNHQLQEDGAKSNTEKKQTLFIEKRTYEEDLDLIKFENYTQLSSEDEEIINNFEDYDVIAQQVLYAEGELDRNNYKGSSAIDYWYEANFNATKKELEYTFYFQGEKETVMESNLKNWYFA